MCGFSGYLNSALHDPAEVLNEMAAAITHRGPDDAGHWWDQNSGIALSHCRLSILDLSEAGHQPMISGCGQYVIAFNGEIYNHLELRTELENDVNPADPGWRGLSDTETLLAAISCWGVEKALKKSVGMFAFALWDRKSRTLILARDRMGEKPLYYGLQGKTFIFGSELKALRKHPDFIGEIDRDVLTLYLRHNYIPAPYSIYKNIYKLLPGTWLQVTDETIGEPQPYWSLRQVAESGQKDLLIKDGKEAVDELQWLLEQSVRGQMLSDVPLGAFLSGGVDSSMVVALMQSVSSNPVKTFTIGFREQGYNEAEYAAAVARHLHTEHTELYVSSQQAMDVIPQIPEIYDEPFSDSSQIPTWLVSKLAREHVTVSLSGDGGDELFAGYNRYTLGQSIWDKARHVPLPVRKTLASFATSVSPAAWNSIVAGVSPLIPANIRFSNPGDKVHKLADVLTSASREELYLNLVSHWNPPSRIVLGGTEPVTMIKDHRQWPDLPDFVKRMMALDAITYMPDDILTKVDRAAMSLSLETRVPLLDHRVVEFAWRLPLSMNIRDGQSKYLLRKVLYRFVPKALIERPKMGFGVPLDSWLRGPLRAWAESLLDERLMQQEGLFDPAPIQQKWREHLSGERNWQYHLWDILMFQAWLRA